MQRVLALFSIVCLAVVGNCASAQTAPDFSKRIDASPRHHEWEDIESAGGRKVHTWIVYPQVDHPATTVLIIHENRGLTDWVRGVADQLAEAGYIAVAPDLLSGTAPGGGNTPEFGSEDKAMAGISKLPKEQVTADLDAVYKFAKAQSAGNKIVAVGGFCWGGGQTFAYATHNPNIASAFVFYGPAPKDEADYKKIAAPVYGFYGGQDFRISGEVPNVEKHMKELGKEYDPVTYEGAQHAFMRLGEIATDKSDANRKAHDQAWERWKKLLAQLK
jgi:carboxymethylenebutenolidase